MTLLTVNREKLEKLASELLLKEMLQYNQIEEILGKRAEGLFPVQAEEEDLPENNQESSREIEHSNNMDQLSQQEQAELEEAVAKLREVRNMPEN